VLLLRGAERRGGLVDAKSIFFSDLFSYFSSSGFVQNLSLKGEILLVNYARGTVHLPSV
jgi:hypothetical protein